MARTKLQEAASRRRLRWGAIALYEQLMTYDDRLRPWTELSSNEIEMYEDIAEAAVRAHAGCGR